MTDIHFCPSCHRPVCRVVPLDGYDVNYEQDYLLAIEDLEMEELISYQREKRVKVLTAPGWRTALITNPEASSNISFGCPNRVRKGKKTKGCQGKVTLFKR